MAINQIKVGNTTHDIYLNKTLTIQGNGTTLTNGSFNGSANKTVNITPETIGAATSEHTHSTYMTKSNPTSSGTFTHDGSATIDDNLDVGLLLTAQSVSAGTGTFSQLNVHDKEGARGNLDIYDSENKPEWNNCLKIGSTILQWGVTETVTVPANDSKQLVVRFDAWNYSTNLPVVMVKPIINTAFDLVEINLTTINPEYFVLQFINKYTGSLAWKANWFAIGVRG